MSNQIWSARAALIGIIIALGIAPAARGQTAAANPWKRVPATPPTCYADHDFATKVSATLQQTVTDLIAAEEANLKAKERFNAMDMNEKSRRMQEYMMKNPQEAAKMLQATSDVGTANYETAAEITKANERLHNELLEHKKAFDAAVDRAVKPVLARQEALIKAKTKAWGEAAALYFPVAADHAQYVALIAEENAEYEKACAPYFGAKGKLHAWLESFKREVSDKAIAAEEATNATIATQMQIVGMPLDSSTGKLRVVREYLRRLEEVTGYRRAQAVPTIPKEKP